VFFSVDLRQGTYYPEFYNNNPDPTIGTASVPKDYLGVTQYRFKFQNKKSVMIRDVIADN
jgi:hypothetical protein